MKESGADVIISTLAVYAKDRIYTGSPKKRLINKRIRYGMQSSTARHCRSRDSLPTTNMQLLTVREGKLATISMATAIKISRSDYNIEPCSGNDKMIANRGFAKHVDTKI